MNYHLRPGVEEAAFRAKAKERWAVIAHLRGTVSSMATIRFKRGFGGWGEGGKAGTKEISNSLDSLADAAIEAFGSKWF